MVLAGDLHGRREAFHPEFLQAGLGDVQGLKAPAHVLARHDLLARHFLGIADRFGDEHRVVDTPVVEVVADLLLRVLREALVDDELLDVLDHRKLGTGRVEVERLVALRVGPAGARIVVTAGPPDADELADREPGLDRLLDRRRVHRAPALVIDPVRTVAANVQPDRALVLHVLRGDRVELDLEAVILRKAFEERDRLLAEGRVEVDEADLLALELVEAAFLLGDILDEGRRAIPVGHGRIEHPGKGVAVRRSRQAIGHRQDGDLVDRSLRDELKRNAGRIGIRDDRIFALDRLVALDAFLRVVARLAFLDGDLHTADAAVTLVEHAKIVVHAVGNRDS